MIQNKALKTYAMAREDAGRFMVRIDALAQVVAVAARSPDAQTELNPEAISIVSDLITEDLTSSLRYAAQASRSKPSWTGITNNSASPNISPLWRKGMIFKDQMLQILRACMLEDFIFRQSSGHKRANGCVPGPERDRLRTSVRALTQPGLRLASHTSEPVRRPG
ncbi:MAG: hypothetical protein AAGH40_14305 [Verrucomicrobiota bacterium]